MTNNVIKGNGLKKKYKLLELFKGTGSVGKVAKRMGMEVVSIDIEPIYTPDIETDILKWDYKKFSKSFIPDFIWASPPCNTFSPLAYKLKERDTKTAEPKSERAKLGTKILRRTITIIKYFKKLNPKLKFCIENPRGMMRNDKQIKKLLRDTTTYCSYGDFKRKPTDFFHNLDSMKLKEVNEDCCKDCLRVVSKDKMTIEEKYSIPSKLVKTILQTMVKDY